MSSTVTVVLERKVWKQIANKSGIVSTQLQTSTGYVELYAGNAAPTGEVAFIRINSASEIPTFSEKALVWARGSGSLTVMTIDA